MHMYKYIYIYICSGLGRRPGGPTPPRWCSTESFRGLAGTYYYNSNHHNNDSSSSSIRSNVVL